MSPIKNPSKREVSSRIILAALQLLGVWTIVAVVFAALVEILSRSLFPYIAPSPWDYRSGNPPAYQSSAFYSQAFVNEAFSHQKWINPPKTRIIYPGDYKGPWFNVQNGIRKTTDQAKAERRVLLIGSSTVYNAEVPDDQTIASYLQRLVNEKSSEAFNVLNYGASGVKVSQQLERLRALTFSEKDVVVFYDGTADAMQGVFYANFDGWIVGENRKHLDSFIARYRLTIENLARWSRFFNWLYANSTNYLPEHLKQPKQIRALAANSKNRLIADIIETNEYVRSKGAVFVHVLQPDLFSKPQLRSFELPLISNHFLTMDGVGPALSVAHTEFASLPGALKKKGMLSHDATALFDSVNTPIYLDFAHSNQTANKMIADFLFESLQEDGIITTRP
jgi:hypothetical protein